MRKFFRRRAMQGWRSAQQVEFGSATSGGKGRERREQRVGKAELGTARGEFHAGGRIPGKTGAPKQA